MAETVKHTEGPWERVDTADYAEIHPVGKRLRSAIALVAKAEDADLVAAAPEMLEALGLVAGLLHWNKLDETSVEVMRRVNSVRAKAEGRA